LTDQSKVTLSFVKLLVRDLEKAAKFYEYLFGLENKVYKEGAIAGRTYREYIYRILPDLPPAANNTAIILMKFDDEQTSGSDVIVVVHTRELSKFIERARSAGAKILQEPIPIVLPKGIQSQNGGGMISMISDDEGHLIEAIGTG
jgi:predicted enzyme related to lactoylglutathione lyase